ncbi:MAG: tyrosine-type recombinase/integrase, partial [Acidobacteriota bacterium]|nr:tyrosine-type recombinase/integrase [Acidobacteriota bacterium]
VLDSKGAAEAEADRIRTAIRKGTFRLSDQAPVASGALTFDAFAALWVERRGLQLVSPKDNEYRLGKISTFEIPGKGRFGAVAIGALTTDDIEAFRDWRKAAGLSPVTVNHDLKLLRKMLNWGIRKGYIERTPFKIGTEAAVSLERETPRNWRFDSDGDERKLLDAANPHLRSIIVALLDTACRPGELLSLQWGDVDIGRKEMTIRAEKAKTRTARIVPLSSRLRAVLEMRKLGPDGKELPMDAYVFGDEIGGRLKSVKTAWANACARAGLDGLQLRDLRHEAGSRLDEAGVPINYVSKMLGHTNLTTTSRYLNIHRRGLQAAMQTLENHQAAVAHSLHTDQTDAQDNVPPTGGRPASKSSTIQ